MGHSYSSLSCFEQCPYKWYLAYIKQEKSKPSYACLRGAKFHKDMEMGGKNLNTLKDYLFNNNPVLYPVVEWFERKGITEAEDVEVKLRNEALNFSGVIDRVDMVNGLRYITDYKTGKDRGIEPFLRQLSIYHWLLETCVNKKADFWCIYYLDHHSQYEVPADDNKVRETVDWIHKTIDEIKNTKEFKKCDPKNCFWCDFKHLCKKREVTL